MRKAPPVRKPNEKAPDREVLFGFHAAQAVFARRPEAIQRAWFSVERTHELAALLRALSAAKRPYHQATEEELSRVAGSVHHEGICLAVSPRPAATLEDLLEALRARETGFALALDQVGNPHNLGAVLRSCAWFGARGLLSTVGLTPAAVRVAEGGAESVPVVQVPSLAVALERARAAGIPVWGAEAAAPAELFSVALPPRVLLVLGSERSGLLPETRARCDRFLRIGGAGGVESLNVSVAAGVLLSAAASRARSPER